MINKDVMHAAVKAFFVVPGSALIFGLVAYIPAVIVLWLFVSDDFARSYGVYICLALGAAWRFRNVYIARNNFVRPPKSVRLATTASIVLLLWGGLAAYKAHVELVQKPAQEEIKKAYMAKKALEGSARDIYEESCQSIRHRYGVSAAKGFQGEYVPSYEDVEVPDRCKGGSLSDGGINSGFRSQISDQR